SGREPPESSGRGRGRRSAVIRRPSAAAQGSRAASPRESGRRKSRAPSTPEPARSSKRSSGTSSWCTPLSGCPGTPFAFRVPGPKAVTRFVKRGLNAGVSGNDGGGPRRLLTVCQIEPDSLSGLTARRQPRKMPSGHMRSPLTITTGTAAAIVGAVAIACGAGAYLYSLLPFQSVLQSARTTALAQGQLTRAG